MLAGLGARLGAIRRRGVGRSVRTAGDQIVLGLLRRRFGFHPWHATSPTSARPYRREVAALVDTLKPGVVVVVEVGCGLGAILARVRAPVRVGYDNDGGAIRAARLIRSRAIRFVEGDFTSVTERDIDVLIAVNCLHDFAPDRVAEWIVPLLGRTRFLLIDRIDPASPTRYAHYHDFAFLDGRSKLVSADQFGEDFREFLLYEIAR